MSIYMVNGELIDLPVNNPTAGDLKKHFGGSEDTLVIVNWPDGSYQLLQDHESIPVNATDIAIIPQYRRGGGPDPLTIAAGIATVTQVFLMIADMWSRRTKEKKASKKQGSTSVPWDEVEHIIVRMSDGNSVEFDSWRSDPKQVRNFIDVFNSPSASVKPKKVVFQLKTRSRVEVVLSDPKSLQELDKLLEFLKQ